MKKLDLKYIILLMLVLFAAWAFYNYPEQVRKAILAFFSLPKLVPFAGVVATIISILHKHKAGKFRFHAGMTFSDFKGIFEDLFSFRNSPITFACSIAFAKALVLQKFGTATYFVNFTDIEMDFIGVLTSYILFISTLEVFKSLNELITISGAQTPKASPAKGSIHSAIQNNGSSKPEIFVQQPPDPKE